MTQISKHRLKQDIYEKIFLLFPKLLGRLSQKGQQQLVIDTLFSPSERTVFAKRIAIALMLIKGFGYADISSKLKVSYGTIGKISQLVKDPKSPFVVELLKIAKEDSVSNFLNTVRYKISSTMPPRGGNWSVWRRRIEQERQQGAQPF